MLIKQIINNTFRTYKSHSIVSRFLKLEILQSSFRCEPPSCGGPSITHFCSAVRGKTYFETENNFIYNALSGIPIRDKVLGLEQEVNDEAIFTSYLNQDWRSSSASDILNAFQTVKSFCVDHDITFSDSRFISLVDGLMDHCDKLTDNQLLELLRCISEYPACSAFASDNYHDMWSCLDDICCWKMGSWDLDTLFIFGDIWFKLKLAKLCDFVFELLDRVLRKADRLTKDQLVHIFFYFNVCRRRPIDFEYEHALQHKICEMNVDEMAVVALGFFKTKSKIKVLSIMQAMVNEVTNNANGIHEISLTAIMKVLRYSHPLKILPDIKKMLDTIYPELDHFSIFACLHVALLCSGLQTCHEDTLRKSAQKLADNLSNIRLKDIERMLNVLTMFILDPKTKPDIFKLAFDELHLDSRLGEINQYPRCLVSALNYFSLRNIYSYPLMDRALDREFITLNFGKHAKYIPLQLFSLDACIDIECPDYTGNRLPLDLKYKAARWLTYWPPTHNRNQKISNLKDKLFLDTFDILKKIVGKEEFLLVQHVLPHFVTADIIVCKDTRTGAFVNPPGFERYILGDVMIPFKDGNLKFYAVVVLTWNNTTRDSSAAFLGHTVMKQRQLQKVGYEPLMVVWSQFMHLSREEKEEYILTKLV